LDKILYRFGLLKAREIYECSHKIPPFSLSYYKKCIQIEKDATNQDLQRIRSLYDRAANDYGKKDDVIWLEYLAFENGIRDFKRSGAVFWKAKKTLENPTQFIAKCQSTAQSITSMLS